MDDSKSSTSFLNCFNRLELESLLNIREEWIVEVFESKNMDQNDALPTKANECQYDYASGAPNFTAPANFECAGEVIQHYAPADESVIAAPISTESNMVTDGFHYNYLSQTNYYESSSMPPHAYERLNPGEGVAQPAVYENYATADINNEHTDQYLHVPDAQSFPYGSVVLQPGVNEQPHNFPQNVDQLNVNDLNNSACVNQNPVNYGDIPMMNNGYSEEVNSVSYAEPSQETVIETSPAYSESVCVTDATWNVNREEVSTMEVDTNSSEMQDSSVVEESSATEQVSQETNSVPLTQTPEPAPVIAKNATENETVVQTEEIESNNIANGEKSKTEVEGQNVQMCIRSGCLNRAINNPEWEQEFCSNDCVIIHCRNVFMAWVKANEIVSQ